MRLSATPASSNLPGRDCEHRSGQPHVQLIADKIPAEGSRQQQTETKPDKMVNGFSILNAQQFNGGQNTEDAY
ncbi:hypothetical protein IID10_18725 [candidate division KSB1 bacterium]|nr:hypothetical protein [candidate division KSB1 bacterium]